VRDIPVKGKLREQEGVEGEKAGRRVERGVGSEGGVVSSVTMAGALSLSGTASAEVQILQYRSLVEVARDDGSIQHLGATQ
jgi:hypothetical protein